MHGLKNVIHRHDDAFSRIGWAELERLLAGTGGTGARFDGGVDLRIRRDAEIVLVQCKYWNAEQVPHNVVHELLGVMVNEGATGAILVSSGEFTRAAIDAAQRHGHMKLIDGETLRGMLGSLPEEERAEAPAPVPVIHSTRATPAGPRINVWFWMVAMIAAIAFVVIVRAILDRTADTAGEPSDIKQVPALQPTIIVYEPQPAVAEPVDSRSPPLPPSEAEIRESQRKADEAMRLIEDTTPEM
jgi:restriction system protein